jgi:cytochrome c biogenesis protein CcdA
VLELLALVLTIGLIDSLNPSTVGPGLFFAAGRNGPVNVERFTLGVFVVYFAGSVLLVLGPGRWLLHALPRPSADAKHVIELAAGVAALVLAAVLARHRESIGHRLSHGTGKTGRSAFALGAGIMALELPTAFPLFAVVAAIVDARVSFVSEIALLAIFNVAFVVPLLLIIGAGRLAGDRLDDRLERLRDWFARRAGILLTALVALVGAGLVALGAIGLLRG